MRKEFCNKNAHMKDCRTRYIAVGEQNSLGGEESSRMFKTKYFQMDSVFYLNKIFTLMINLVYIVRKSVNIMNVWLYCF